MKTILKILLLFSALNLNAQKHELGKVTIDELKQKSHPNDSSAVAAVLFDIGGLEFKNSAEIFTKKVKIKIYKKEGFNYANIVVNCFSDSFVKFTNAYTYNLVNNKIEKTKLESDGEFRQVIDKNYNQVKISFPNVKEGSIIEYNLETRNGPNFNEWIFQQAIPVNYSEFSNKMSDGVTVKEKYKGFFLPKVTSKRVIDVAFPNSFDVKTTYVLENVPALKAEPYVNNMNNYAASVKIIVSEVVMENYFYNSNRIYYSGNLTNWGSISKELYERDDFGLELNKSGYFENDIDGVFKEVTIGDEKIYAIYAYVQKRMVWDGYYGIVCDKGVKTAYKDKIGNSADINLMLTAMLRYAGFNASPVVISTRSNGIADIPSLALFNHVLTAIEFNGQIILLDATNKNALPNILPLNDLNFSGRLIRKDGTSQDVDLIPNFHSTETLILIGDIDLEGKLTGKARHQYYDYNAFVFRENNSNVAEDIYLENLEKKYDGIEIGEYEVLNAKDLKNPIVENYSFAHKNAIEIIGNRMYFSPLVFFAQTKNPFTQETRQYPIDFDFPNQSKYNITIQYPEGYVVETLPKPASIAMHKDLGSFNYMISNVSNKCQFSFSVNINRAIISADDYEIVQAFFKELIEKENEKIVLVKK